MTSLNNNLSIKNGKQVLIVTGVSGAGKTILVRSLEDFGFYCVDNLPLPLLSSFLHLAFHTQTDLLKVALVIDARGEKFLSDFICEVEKEKVKKGDDVNLKIIFLNAGDQTLLRRFQETRRKHPLAGRGVSISNAISKEKELLEPIKKMADIVIDTDIFNIHELRKWVKNSFADEHENEIVVNLISFGFKFGVPSESNLVYDLRFLPNPYFVSELKTLDGRNELIHDYLFTQSVVKDYWKRLKSFLSYSAKKFHQEGRFFANVAVGCTGGKHRSVAFVEKLGKENWDNVRFLVHHRDMGKE